MKFGINVLTASIALLTTAAFADDQNPFDLPVCQGQRMTEIFGAGFQGLGCGSTDVQCICSYPSYVEQLPTISTPLCTQDQASDIQKNLKTQCAKVGVQVFTGDYAPVTTSAHPLSSTPTAVSGAVKSTGPSPGGAVRSWEGGFERLVWSIAGIIWYLV